ncbi:fimbria major subunit [Porphyromonas somerae]|uniref:fimbria major subunit n=1 Tax=Porphyromonas somerae TaxID=322095 RepID=UPI001FCB7746|nr:fimbria major subunit [Porphyromonas somerae]BDE81500.1 hypothetical protein CE91St14_05280 [Porphyromonas somerae]
MTNISRSINQKLATLSGVLLALLLSLTGCQKERFVPEEDLGYRHTAEFDEGSTYMSLAIRTTPPTTDPATQQEAGAKDGKESATGEESFTTWQGDDIIENFAVYIVSEGIDKVQPIAGSVNDSSLATWDPDKQELLLNPFRSAPVSKRIFAFFNIPTQYQKYLDEKLNNKEEFLKRISEPIPYMGEKGITYDGDAPLLEAFRPDSHIATKEIATGPSAMIPDVPSFTDKGRPGYDGRNPRRNLDFPTAFFDTRMNETKPGPLPCIKRKDRILSSGVRYNYLPEDNITEEEVKDGRNLVQVYTRRVLAQAVVTAEADLVKTPIPELGGMVIKGVSFQVFNFEPTFYPIAKTTKEGEWPGNKNTETPLYNKTDNSSRINMTTYQSTIADEEFTADALVRDRFFRSAHFVYGEGPAELDPADENYAQKLLREMRIEYKDSKKLYDGIEKQDMSVPTRGTTFWGSCYVTESTQKWGTDASSGYNTSNTPFFAVVAYFDTEKLPWGDKTITTAKAKIDNKQKDLDNQLKEWRDKRDAKQAELDALPKAGGGSISEADANAIFQAYVQWWEDHLKNSRGAKSYLNKISKQRDKFIKTKELDEAGYLDKIKRERSTLRGQDFKDGTKLADKGYRNRKYPENKRVGSPTELDAPDLDVEQEEFKKTFEADRKLRAGDPNAEKRQQLNDEIKALNKKIEDFKNEFNSSGDKYPKLENTTTNKEFYTQFIYEQGINRIFYSLADHKFYLNYHEIPFAKRGGQRHTLTENDPWLDELKSKLPNGKDFPTEANEAPATAAVLPPSADLMSRLSQLLNGEIPETDLNPAERRSMDFYLYGRVAPGLVQYFGGAERIDRIDLQSGYVAWYTANKKDNVVSYPCYVRNKKVDNDGKETKSSISNVRLMMVYYAWLNPNTQESGTTYASPVLRNNIYHMHITGFTKMGLSAIPFVPRVPEGNGYKFLHWKLDPDEEVPAANAPLNATSGTGSPTSLSTPRSSSFSLTF